ncbi:MAG: hypothetical protein C3F02_00090 [Parcubacteria group bacterium]|nr:MAG: hypothetical protein C3F02_00090 [Parcubacteria group bacterium]
MEENKGIINNLSPKAAFKAGLVSGLLIIIVIGFFILLGVILSGKLPIKNNNGANNAAANNNAVANNGQVAPSYDYAKMATAAGADKNKFNSCFSAKKYTDKINAQSADAQKAGAQGTPYAVIISGNTKVPIKGALPFADVKNLLDAVINNDATQLKTMTDDTIVIPAVDKNKDWIKGDKNASISIVEYSDMQCPYCQRFHGTMIQVMDAYKDKINWIYRHFPLTSIHDYAMDLAQASECVGEISGNDAFWKFVDSSVQTQ